MPYRISHECRDFRWVGRRLPGTPGRFRGHTPHRRPGSGCRGGQEGTDHRASSAPPPFGRSTNKILDAAESQANTEGSSNLNGPNDRWRRAEEGRRQACSPNPWAPPPGGGARRTSEGRGPSRPCPLGVAGFASRHPRRTPPSSMVPGGSTPRPVRPRSPLSEAVARPPPGPSGAGDVLDSKRCLTTRGRHGFDVFSENGAACRGPKTSSSTSENSQLPTTTWRWPRKD